MAEQPKPGSIVHVEIPTKDLAKTKKFYGEVFGWKFQDMPEMNYTMFEAPGGPAGGLRAPMEKNDPGVLNYILVNSIDETLKKVEKAGGRVLHGKQEIPGPGNQVAGWMAIFQDSTGAVQAIWKAGPQPQQPPK